MQNDERDLPPTGATGETDESAEEFETAPAGAVGGGPESAEVPHRPTQEPSEPSASPSNPPPSEAEAYASAPPDTGPPPTAAHSVPATPVGESTLCPRCGTENRPGVAFCRTCGQRLIAAGVATTVERPRAPDGTQQCPRCGTHNRAGVAFCQNCGANLRAAQPLPAPGTAAPVGPAETVPATTGALSAEPVRGGAWLGPIVLLIGAVGLATAWLLPFPYGPGSLWDRSFGAVGGYGVAFWNGYAAVGGGLTDRAYFGFAAPVPLLVALLAVLAVAGFLRAAPGRLQGAGLALGLAWALGLAIGFVVVEVGGGWHGDLVTLLRGMSPAGIIFLLASLIVLIGGFTRVARS
jgi:Double zinc ribbon